MAGAEQTKVTAIRVTTKRIQFFTSNSPNMETVVLGPELPLDFDEAGHRPGQAISQLVGMSCFVTVAMIIIMSVVAV